MKLPDFWKNNLKDIDDIVASVKKGRVKTTYSAGGRAIYLVEYGTANDYSYRTANFNSAAGAHDITCYADKFPHIFLSFQVTKKSSLLDYQHRHLQYKLNLFSFIPYLLFLFLLVYQEHLEVFFSLYLFHTQMDHSKWVYYYCSSFLNMKFYLKYNLSVLPLFLISY